MKKLLPQLLTQPKKSLKATIYLVEIYSRE